MDYINKCHIDFCYINDCRELCCARRCTNDSKFGHKLIFKTWFFFLLDLYKEWYIYCKIRILCCQIYTKCWRRCNLYGVKYQNTPQKYVILYMTYWCRYFSKMWEIKGVCNLCHFWMSSLFKAWALTATLSHPIYLMCLVYTLIWTTFL